MKRLFAFEFRKAWYRKGWLIPAALLGVILFWILVAGGKTLTMAFDDTIHLTNEETRSYWGQPVTEEFRQIARQKALECGAEEKNERFSCDAVAMTYGIHSREWVLCSFWCSYANMPTLEEEQGNGEKLMQYVKELYEQGIYSNGMYRSMIRSYENPAVYEIGPGSCAWRFCLDSEGYAPLLAGVSTLALIFIIVGPIFCQEEGGGMREISLSKPKRNQWILAKIYVSICNGALIALALNLGLLLFYGLLYGFQGWNVSAMTYTGAGWVYGLMYRPISCLGLACLRFLLFSLCGGFMGVMTATCSAIMRQTLHAVGLDIAICTIMESLLFIVYAWRNHSVAIQGTVQKAPDMVMLDAVFATPVRAFLNPEVLTIQTIGLSSDYSNLLMHNIVITPELAIVFFGLTLIGIALCAGLCFTYQRQR